MTSIFCAEVFSVLISLVVHVVVIQSLSHAQLFETPWTTACQASLSTISWSLFNLMSFELVVTSNHLVLCCPLLLLPSIIPRIKVFPNKSTLHGLWGSLIHLIIFMFGQAPQSSLALKLGYPHTSLYENPEQ